MYQLRSIPITLIYISYIYIIYILKFQEKGELYIYVIYILYVFPISVFDCSFSFICNLYLYRKTIFTS